MDLKFKWNMLVSSFIPLWVSIIILDGWDIGVYVINEWDKEASFCDGLMQFVNQKWLNIICILGLIILSLIAIIWLNKFLKEKHELKDKMVACKVISAKKERSITSEFLLAYILPLIAFDFTSLRDVIVFLLLFSVLSFLCIRNNNIYINIILEFMGYKFYSCKIDYVIALDHKEYENVLFISKIDMLQRIGSEVSVLDFSQSIFINLEDKINEQTIT